MRESQWTSPIRAPGTTRPLGSMAGGELDGLVTAAGDPGPDWSARRSPGIGAGRRGRDQPDRHDVRAALLAAPPARLRWDGRSPSRAGAERSPLPRYDAYAASKAAVVRLTENLAASEDVEINSVAPGFVATRMHQQTLQAGPHAAGQGYYDRTRTELAGGGFPRGGRRGARVLPAVRAGSRHQRPADQRPVGPVARGRVPRAAEVRQRARKAPSDR